LKAPFLRGPVTIVGVDRQYELSRGSLIIGRSPTADIVIDDPLVSRMHARVVLRDDSAVIEDLNSTNGVYLDGARLPFGLQPLREGDRVLIGTNELSFFSAASVRPFRLRTEEATPRVSPPATGSSARPTIENIPPTDRANVGQLVARLAERFNRAGNSEEATRVVSAHLHRVLWGVTSGTVEAAPNLIHEAARQAMQVFGWTQNPAWIDYVFELHLAANSLLSEDGLAAVEVAVQSARGREFDVALLRTYIAALEDKANRLNLVQQARLLRLHILLRSMG
jgi:pSer/pThr/pTyr-binding forkhead associated (FHA) protein